MTTERNRIALENTLNYYDNAKIANSKVAELVKKFKEVDDDGKNDVLDDINIYLKDLIKFTNKIVITIIERTYPKEVSDKVVSNIATFRRNIAQVDRLLRSKRLLDASIYNIEVLVDKAAIKRYEYYPYAKNPKDLAYKIALILTDIKNVDEYETFLTRISNGRLSVDEFSRLFHSIKNKLPEVQDATNESFSSFSSFKKKLTNGI